MTNILDIHARIKLYLRENFVQVCVRMKWCQCDYDEEGDELLLLEMRGMEERPFAELPGA